MIDSYLEFGVDNGKKKVYDIRKGQEAYDFFMVGRYLKDMMAYKNGDINRIHHKEDMEDNLKKYSALSICQKPIFYEVGSSLMGVIESLEFLNKKFKKLDIKKIKFVGVDNSKMMNFVAAATHQKYKMKLYEKIQNVKCGLFFAKGVSLLYSFDNEKQFCDVIKNAEIAIFDYTFSLKIEPIKKIVGTGKSVTYLSLWKCKDYLRDKNKNLFLGPSKRDYGDKKNKVTYECVYGNKVLLKQYFKQLDKLSIDIK